MKVLDSMGSVCVNKQMKCQDQKFSSLQDVHHKPNQLMPTPPQLSNPLRFSSVKMLTNNGDGRISHSWVPSVFRLWLLQDMMSGSWQQAAELTWPLSQIHEQKPPHHHWHLWDTVPVKTADRSPGACSTEVICLLCTGSGRKPNPVQANQLLEQPSRRWGKKKFTGKEIQKAWEHMTKYSSPP